MKRHLFGLVALLALSGCGGDNDGGGLGATNTRGTVVSYSKITTYGLEVDVMLDYIESQSDISLDWNSDVDLYKVTYWTVDVKGNAVQATGAVAVPESPGANLALCSYQHSTVTDKTNVPSGDNDEGWAVLSIFAGSGNYVVSMPDYLGLGGSAGLHPYMHAASEASASLDMMRATRALCNTLNVDLSGDVVLAGYSQGGHSTMALTREIESTASAEFNVRASGPGAGPYDLSDTELNFAFDQPSTDTPAFLGYIILAYRDIYGIMPNLSAVFQSPYDTTITGYYNGKFDLSQIAQALPAQPSDLFTSTFQNSVLNDPGNDPFVQKLVLNDLWEWTPRTTIKLFHAQSDNVVSYQNSVKAHTYMSGQGAPVTLETITANVDHEGGFFYAVPMARQWFDSILGFSSTGPAKQAGPGQTARRTPNVKIRG